MTIIRIIEINEKKNKVQEIGNLTAGRQLPKFSKTKIILFI